MALLAKQRGVSKLFKHIPLGLSCLLFSALPVLAGAGKASGQGKKVVPSPSRNLFVEIAQQEGTLIPRGDAPQAYAAVEEIMRRLLPAQKAAASGLAGLRSQIFLIDSPTVNAFIVPFAERKGDRQQSLVFLYKGLIEELWKKAAGDNARFEKMLIGVIAHELAHPIDMVDADSLKKANAENQLIEVRADIDGSKLSREAKLPRDSVHETLTALGGSERNGKWYQPFQAGASSHPEDQVRIGAQRIWLTMDRFENGDGEIEPLRADTKNVHEELQKLRYQWDPLKLGRYEAWTVDRALDQLEAALPKDSPVRDKKGFNVRFNFWVTKLNEELSRPGARVTAAQNQRIADFYASYLVAAEDALPKIFGASDEELQRKYISDVRAQELAKEVPHYREPAFRKALLDAIEKRAPSYPERAEASARSKLFGVHRELLNKLRETGVLPREEVGREWESYLQRAIRNRVKTGHWDYLSYELPDLWKPLPEADQLKLSHYVRTEVVPKLSPAERLVMDSSVMSHDSNQFLYLTGQSSAEKLKSVLESGDDAGKNRLREIAAGFWKDRKTYLVSDLVEGNTERWKNIFEILGIPEEQGVRELRETFKKYASSADYVRFLEKFGESDIKRPYIYYHKPRALWADPSLIEYASGKHNPGLKNRPELLAVAEKEMGFRMALESPNDYLKNTVMEELARKISAKPSITARQIIDSQAELFRKYYGEELEGLTDEAHVARAVADSKLPPARKRKLLRDLFLVYQPTDPKVNYAGFKFLDWTYDRDPNRARDVLGVLVDQKVLPSASSLFEEYSRVAKHLGDIEDNNGIAEAHYKGLPFFAENLRKELDDLKRAPLPVGEKAEALLGFARRVFDPWDRGSYEDMGNAGKRMFLRDLKREAVELAGSLPLSPKQQLELFHSMTAGAPSRETDTYFQRIRSKLPNTHLAEALSKNRLESNRLKVETVAKLQEAQVANLAKTRNMAEFGHMVEAVTKLVPESSSFKDDYLESLAWKLQIDDPQILQGLEAAKSTNWKNTNKKSVNFASFFSQYLKDISPDGREALIQYFRDPKEMDFPPALDEELKKVAGLLSHVGMGESRQHEAYSRMRSALEGFALELTREERIPILDNLLHDPKRNLGDVSYQKEIIHKFLKVAPGSKEEVGLLAYLNKTVPDYERSVTLAYLLSVSGEEKSSVLPIFEVHQAVGKKVGQLAATWKVFNDEVTEQLQKLKDRAKPLTKYEIVKLLRERMSPEEFAKIKGVREVLGSASLKTVVLVDLVDGNEAVVALRFPGAERPIHSNLKRAGRFLGAVAEEEAHPSAPIMKQFIGAAGEQLVDELKFTKEAEHLESAKKYFERLNSRLAQESHGWRFAVPGLKKGFQARDDLLVMDVAKGMSFHKLPPGKDKMTVGELIVDSSLEGLFEHGIFDPDRHRGNILVDSETKTIRPLDFGQLQKVGASKGALSVDERLNLSLLLWAIDSGDASDALKQALALSTDKAELANKKHRLILAELQQLFSRTKDFDERLLGLTSVLGKHEVPMKSNFLAGTLKGLMILKEEGYVSQERFREMIRARVASVVKEKWPLTATRVATRSVKNAIAGCQESFSNLSKALSRRRQ